MIRQDNEKLRQSRFAIRSLLVLTRFCSIANFTDKSLASENELSMAMIGVWEQNINYLDTVSMLEFKQVSRAFGHEIEIHTRIESRDIDLNKVYEFLDAKCQKVYIEFVRINPITEGQLDYVIRFTFKNSPTTTTTIREQFWKGFDIASMTTSLSADVSHLNSIRIIRAWNKFHKDVVHQREALEKN